LPYPGDFAQRAPDSPAVLPQEPPSWFTGALAVPAEDRGVPAGGARIAYRAWGSPGSPGVVLVHGTAAHARWWDHIAPFLAADGLRVAALSISGHGDSDHRDRYSMAQWAAEVMKVAADAGIAGQPFVIGHSLGGAIALRAAERYGGTLAGAVVIDTIIFEEFSDGQAPAEFSLTTTPFGVGRTHATREAVLARFRLVPEQPVLPYVREHIAAWSVTVKGNGEWGWKFDQALFSKLEPSPPATSPGCPVAVFRAEHGLMTRPMADQLRRQAGGAAVPVTEIPAAGHHVLLDEPLSLITALRTLLANWTAKPAG
jgi:pimeloyl-ACP methyl ester carboxylesterase